jgi:predicted ATP-binding protein involved in virulence
VKLSKLTITETTCFKKVSLDLTRDGKPAEWIIILGENGTGKSTLLKMLALNLMGSRMPLDVVDRFRLAKFAANGSKSVPHCYTEIAASWHDTNKERGIINYTSENSVPIQRLRGEIFVGSVRHGGDTSDRLYKSLFSEEVQGGWFCAGYGPWRRASFSGRSLRQENVSALGSTKSGRFASLFNEDYSLSAFTEWIIDLEYQVLKNPQDYYTNRVFTLATSIFANSLPGFKFHSINSNKEIILTDGKMEITVDQLSDGYKSVASWTGDLVKLLIEAFPNSEDPTKEEGVVIIDEIDIHLHPKWQRDIVNQTRRVFPNIQFIVTTHSPFVAQDLTENDKLFVTRQNGDDVQIYEWTQQLIGWRVDQILTSELFGLKTTRGEEIEDLETERNRLTEKSFYQEFSIRDAERLNSLDNKILKMKSNPAEESDRDLVYDAASLFLDLIKQEQEKK